MAHTEFTAGQFNKAGIVSAAAYSGSAMGRTEALDRVKGARLSVLFSVDLFNEGVDLPNVDTILMLRPTESKTFFLQQVGRGLRLSDEKTHLVVLDCGDRTDFPTPVGPTRLTISQMGESSNMNITDLVVHSCNSCLTVTSLNAPTARSTSTLVSFMRRSPTV